MVIGDLADIKEVNENGPQFQKEGGRGSMPRKSEATKCDGDSDDGFGYIYESGRPRHDNARIQYPLA